MRTVLITTPYFSPKVGGLENYAFHIAMGLKNNGWNVIVACGDEVIHVQKDSLQGVKVYRLPIWKVISNTPVHFKWRGLLRTIIAQEKPDIIISHSPVPFMVDMTALVSGNIPLVITYHAATLSKPGNPLMKLATSAYRGIEKLTFLRASAIIAVSSYVQQSRTAGEQKKTVVIPNAIAQVNSPKTHASSGLVFIANLEATHQWKGLDNILEALAICKARYGSVPSLTVMGDGAMKPTYVARAKQLAIDGDVEFVGQKVGIQKDLIIRRSLALIAYPTTANDAFPTVLVEAWGQGTAVVVSDIGPMPSLVDHERTGLIADAASPAALAELIHRVATEPTFTAAMGENGRLLTAREYIWPKQVQATVRLLESLL